MNTPQAAALRNATFAVCLKMIRTASDLDDAARMISNLRVAMNDFDARYLAASDRSDGDAAGEAGRDQVLRSLPDSP